LELEGAIAVTIDFGRGKSLLPVKPGGQYTIRTCDLLRVNCKVGLFFIVVEANSLFCACPYFSLKELFFNIVLKSISAELVPIIE
jgi:hypothetical protein